MIKKLSNIKIKDSFIEHPPREEKMNYKNYGGAILLGVNGVVVKAHGNSDDYSFFKALELAYKMASTGIVEKLKEGFENDDH